MGFLKKITRPISRVLDKIVPNELKPALPFLAAAAPFMAPGLMGIGGNTMFSRALMSGGLNLGAQLAQEGSDGDFSGLSTLMAAATGALSAPGADAKLRGMKFGDSTSTIARTPFGPQVPYGPVDQAGISTLQRGANIGLEGLAKSAQFLGPSEGGVTDILGKGGTEVGFNKATATAAMVPLTQATTDLAVAENRRALKAYEQDLADYEASMGDQATDEGRALAIRTAMLRYGFTEDEITDTISSAGYRAGGRVGLMMGGDPDFSGIKGAVESVDKNMSADRAGDFFRLRDEAIQKGDSDKIKEIESDFFREFGMVMPKMMAGGELEKNIFLQGGPTIERLLMNKEEKKQDKDKIKKELEELGIFKRKKVAEGGLMNLGVKEMDMRGGGFIPIGKKERADDVPARLSKNEFVMTADAVRAAGGGSVNEGAKRMYETMNRLEARA